MGSEWSASDHPTVIGRAGRRADSTVRTRIQARPDILGARVPGRAVAATARRVGGGRMTAALAAVVGDTGEGPPTTGSRVSTQDDKSRDGIATPAGDVARPPSRRARRAGRDDLGPHSECDCRRDHPRPQLRGGEREVLFIAARVANHGELGLGVPQRECATV